jgi:repressor LexA
MIEQSIHDGDFATVLRGEQAPVRCFRAGVPRGDAQALLPGRGEVRLQPANPHMKPIYVAATDVRVQGVVVGLMRKF